VLSALQRRVATLERAKAKALHMQAELDEFATWARLEIDAGTLDADFGVILTAVKSWGPKHDRFV
jgi:hypothetical protein